MIALHQRLDGLRYAPSLAMLAKEFDVTERTIRRDLELLESLRLKVPIWRYNESLVTLHQTRTRRGEGL